jgi:hypothetical protein
VQLAHKGSKQGCEEIQMTRILFGLLLSASLIVTSSAFAGPEPTNAVPVRSVGESAIQQTSCTQQSQSWSFAWLLRPKERNVDCAPSSASAASAPLVLGIGY